MRARTPSSQTDDDRSTDAGFEPDVVYISPDEWLVLFEQEVQEWLGIDAAEFVRRYRAGAYEERENSVTELFAASIPFYESVIRG